MASEVSICNSALIKLGGELITSLSGTDKASILCYEMYPTLRDALLCSHLWNFAEGTYTCPEITGGSNWEYEHSYQLPTDCLRVISVDVDADVEWRRMEGVIFTDYSESTGLNIKYVKAVTDPNKFSAMFRETLALYIASEIGFSITQSTTQVDKIVAKLEKQLKEARHIDSQEGTPKSMFSDTFIASRA